MLFGCETLEMFGRVQNFKNTRVRAIMTRFISGGRTVPLTLSVETEFGFRVGVQRSRSGFGGSENGLRQRGRSQVQKRRMCVCVCVCKGDSLHVFRIYIIVRVRASVDKYICLCARVRLVQVCVLRGSRGSIRGSGHVAQTQVIEGKEEEEEELLEVGGGWRVEGGGRGAHVWL